MNTAVFTQFSPQLENLFQSLINSGLVKSRKEAIQASKEMLDYCELKADIQRRASNARAGNKVYDSDELFEDIVRRGQERLRLKNK